MHDTAYQIGGLVMDTYLPLGRATILDIGSEGRTGMLRDHAPRNSNYTSIDLSKDKDASIWDRSDIPDAYFDFVSVSSVFEYDRTFWRTFLSMCKKANAGGHIYITSASNGSIQRHSEDYWRFYPGCGLALEAWAREEGLDVTLVESFIAERGAATRNEFCAVFRRGPSNAELNRDFVHNRVDCANAINWRSSRVINATDDPEDVRLLRAAREEARSSREDVERIRETEARRISDLAQKIDAQRSELAELTRAMKVQEKIVQDQKRSLETAEAERDKEKMRKDSLEHGLSAPIKELSAEKSTSDRRMQERFREIAGLTQLIQERDQAMAGVQAQMEWQRQLLSVLTKGFATSPKARLAAWLPSYFSHKRQKKLLKDQNLFDPEFYTASYPDVSKSKTDPLRHYINHGLKEGRSIRKGA